MPLAVLPALVEDIPRVYDVQFAAFRDEPIMRFLYPNGVDRELHTKGTVEWWNHDRIGHTVKCVETDTGEIVGMATWEIYWRPGEENAYQKPDGIPWLTGDDKVRCERILVPMWDMRVKLFGKRRYIYLSTIAVDPDHQRKGIGRKLMQWGADVADQLELPIYTEASDTGFSLYSSVGFERLTHVKLVHSAEARGKDEAAEVPLVVRMPKAAGGISFKRWSDAGFPKDFNVHGNGVSA
ncbi:GNAT family [Colletotrichum karsti]|uniref:GNAT family n=1 Tax=Colletotrichum karsti TaxID=1095194 RepID=A0A9P6HWS0_9PEZI|nr:GNAT family [Colletotrichum karsti]KAF9871432.1 GNAT family [Colletotrichum karsti]